MSQRKENGGTFSGERRNHAAKTIQKWVWVRWEEDKESDKDQTQRQKGKKKNRYKKKSLGENKIRSNQGKNMGRHVVGFIMLLGNVNDTVHDRVQWLIAFGNCSLLLQKSASFFRLLLV